MLSVPAKSARRISSLLSLRTNKDNPESPDSLSPSPSLTPKDHRRVRSVSARHEFDPYSPSGDARPITSSGLAEPFDLDTPLPPPPSLVDINHSLAEPSRIGCPNHSRSRSQSRSRASNRPSSSVLSPPAVFSTSSPSGSPIDDRRRNRSLGKSRNSSIDARPMGPAAWIAGLDKTIPYDLGPLIQGEPIPELWNESGDTFVYLYPRNSRRDPSFKVDSSTYTDSQLLTFLARGEDVRRTAVAPGSRPQSWSEREPSPTVDGAWAENDGASSGSARMTMVDDNLEDLQPLHLYLPIPLHGDVSNSNHPLSAEDRETLLLYRNFFAFLLGQALVATPRSPSLFHIFMDVVDVLRRFEFSNLDGSTFGEAVTSSFAHYCEELHLTDVRKSKEKAIEAIILGESLRFYPLYLEGFVHGVGSLDEIWQMASPKYQAISPVTLKRLERGYIDLENRLKVASLKLNDFDYPSLWSGIANSNTANESKTVHFKAWKAALLSFRKWIVSYYRQKYGSWPPKARSKKNEFEGGGLHRLLLKELYDDFADLYDMLVDRTSLTTRTTDMASDDLDAADPMESIVRALRRMESEYDRSTPPVQPPIPFDIPQFPSVIARRAMDPAREAKERLRKLPDADINEVLMGSYTREALRPTAFIESFMQFERRSAHGKSVEEMIDNRCGQWLFLYAVIQSLPLLVVDVPDLRHTEGVEYFLCVAPRGGAPWAPNDPKTGRSWFGIAGGAGVVNLPSDVVTNGVEGVFRRSHCWQVATQWVERNNLHVVTSPSTDDAGSVFSAPMATNHSSIGSASDIYPAPLMLNTSGHGMSPVIGPRTASPSSGLSPAVGLSPYPNRSSIHPGLEALPLPAGVMPVDPPTKPVVRHNPHMSFDDILREIPQKKK